MGGGGGGLGTVGDVRFGLLKLGAAVEVGAVEFGLERWVNVLYARIVS